MSNHILTANEKHENTRIKAVENVIDMRIPNDIPEPRIK